MTKLSYLTPDGQVTIPRSLLKSLNINGGNDIKIEVHSGVLVLRKIEETERVNEEAFIYKAG